MQVLRRLHKLFLWETVKKHSNHFTSGNFTSDFVSKGTGIPVPPCCLSGQVCTGECLGRPKYAEQSLSITILFV